MKVAARSLRFPKKFIWGVAAAAPQIEGAAFLDGKKASTWDTFSRVPGKVRNGETLDVACDHYHRYRSDFKLLASLGVKHYRLSLAWPRILPDGKGTLNRKGVDFYHRLFDSMMENGIEPWVTMFHWDLPQALEDEGGWRNRATSYAFGEYANAIVKLYGRKVRHWITLNEIPCFTRLAYGGGDKAPGRNDSEAVVNQTFHHAILAHGLGVQAVREHGQRRSRVGLTDVPSIPIPVMETEDDIAAAKSLFASENWRILDAIYRGGYSEAYLRAVGKDRPVVQKGDFEVISRPTDFLGANIYTGFFVRCGKRGKPEKLPMPPRYPCADSPWLVHTPQAMYWGPRLCSEVYKINSVFITENGAGYDDEPPVAGEVFDLHRRDFLRNYLKELHRAVSDGIPVHGYFLWSFMDNFEWQDGYNRRFGVVYTDFKTQKRTPKLSAYWYQKVMAQNMII